MTEDQGPHMPRPAPAGHVLVAGLVMLVLASLLNAPALERTAERQPHGVKRDAVLSVVGPLRAFSSMLMLDRPRLYADRLLGRAPQVTAGPAPVPVRPAGEVDTTLRPATLTDPIDVWVIGDSFVEIFGVHLTGRLQATGAARAEMDFRFISGLMRPDYFDWPSHIRSYLQSNSPDAVVVMFGGNDGRDIEVDGRIYELLSPEWMELYQERIAQIMDLLRADHRRVYWVGLPIMRSDSFSRTAARMNEAYAAEAALRPWVSYIPTWDLFADESGRYSDYLPDAAGNLRLMRYPDGAHFTPHGAARLARYLVQEMESDWAFPD